MLSSIQAREILVSMISPASPPFNGIDVCAASMPLHLRNQQTREHVKAIHDAENIYAIARYNAAKPVKQVACLEEDEDPMQWRLSEHAIGSVVLPAVEKAKRRIESLKAHITDFFSELPVQLQSHHHQVSTDMHQDLTQLLGLLRRIQSIAGPLGTVQNETAVKDSRGHAQKAKAKLLLARTSQNLRTLDKSQQQFLPSLSASVKCLLHAAAAQGTASYLSHLTTSSASFSKQARDSTTNLILARLMTFFFLRIRQATCSPATRSSRI